MYSEASELESKVRGGGGPRLGLESGLQTPRAEGLGVAEGASGAEGTSAAEAASAADKTKTVMFFDKNSATILRKSLWMRLIFGPKLSKVLLLS